MKDTILLSYYCHECMIATIIYKDWVKNQVMTQFGSLKIDNEEDTVMCSYDNVY